MRFATSMLGQRANAGVEYLFAKALFIGLYVILRCEIHYIAWCTLSYTSTTACTQTKRSRSTVSQTLLHAIYVYPLFFFNHL